MAPASRCGAQWLGDERNLSCDWVDGAKATESRCWSDPFANNEHLIQQCGEKSSSSSRNGKETGRRLQTNWPIASKYEDNEEHIEIRISEMRHLLYSASENG